MADSIRPVRRVEIPDRLVALEHQLRMRGLPLASRWSPGVSEADLDEAGLASGDLRAWFATRNGVRAQEGDTQESLYAIPGYWPLSLQEALALRRSFVDPVLGEDWLPLLASGGGDMFCAVMAATARPVVAGVLIGEPTEIEFESLDQMLETFSRCYEQGAFFVGPDGLLDMDPDRYDDVCARVAGSGVRPAVMRLMELGQLPADDGLGEDEAGWYDDALKALPDRPTADEARALMRIFPPDDSDAFGMAWTILHAVERSPAWPFWDELDDRNWWVRHLRERCECGGLTRPD